MSGSRSPQYCGNVNLTNSLCYKLLFKLFLLLTQEESLAKLLANLSRPNSILYVGARLKELRLDPYICGYSF